MKEPTKLFVSPNRPNLRFSVLKVKKKSMLAELDWLVSMVEEHGINMPKTIIFCDTMYTIASVANYLMMQLKCNAFHPRSSKNREDCLLGIMHSVIQKEYKDRLLNSLKGEGTKRIAIATTSLSMGVNFPNIRYIIMFGLPRSLLDLHQEAGRGGRDGLPTDVQIVFYGQQVSHCEDDVREFVNSTGCYRVAAYSSFDQNITALLPAHQCCNYCSKTCICDFDGCNQPNKPFEKKAVEQHVQQHRSRIVSEEEKRLLSESLQQLMKGMFAATMSPFGATSSHGFSQELISDVVTHCHNIFTQDDIYHLIPTFSKMHAIKILCILSEIFDDIDELSLTNEAVGDLQHIIYEVTGLDELIRMSDYHELDCEFEELDILE